MADQTFPKTCRLLDAKAFERVFDNPDIRLSNSCFLVLARRSDHGNSKLGIIVAKKHLSLAVDRNRVKRQIRECFRLGKAGFANYDLVVLAKKGLSDLEKGQHKTHIQILLDELGKKLQQY